MGRSKKMISLISVCCLVLGLFAGCGNARADGKTTSAQITKSESEIKATTTPTEEVTKDEKEKAEGSTEKPNAETAAPKSSLAVPSTCGQLQVSGTRLVDEKGNPVQLKGISTHGIAWFWQYVNAEAFTQFREEWQANVIRLAMYTDENSGYCSDGDREQLKQLVRDGVQYATDADMYVIVDWHILSDGNPQTHKAEAIEFFAEMTREFADHNNVIYEICNEPNGSATWSDVKSYAQEVIPVIRGNDADAVILIGTPNWSQYVDQAAADPVTGFDNLMYTLHFYAATHTDSLRQTLIAAVDAGLPVFVSEYGICDASGNGVIDEAQANAWVDVMNQYQISYVMWNLSNKDESSSILVSSCTKTSGFTQEDLSTSGIWLINMLKSQNSNSDSARGSTSDVNAANQNTADDSKTAADTKTGTGASAAGAGEIIKCGDIEITAVMDQSWEAEGKTFYKYVLSLKNTAGSACSSWEVDVNFNEAFTLSDSWNGDYTVNGNVLHITAKDYNGSIDAGGSVGDVGFIVSGSTNLSL